MPSQIDTLLRLVPDAPQNVLSHLQTHPSFASAADTTGYSLLHAAASYNQLTLLRTLVQTYGVDVNIKDEEGETPIFAAESLSAVKCLVEELGADTSVQNEEGTTAEENAFANMDDGGEWPMVADYLERLRTGGSVQNGESSMVADAAGGDIGGTSLVAQQDLENGDVHPPAPLPPNVRINMGTMQETPLDSENGPDPDFRRRIEELAARDDFQSEEGQSELRKLVEDAIGGMGAGSDDRDVRRRLD